MSAAWEESPAGLAYRLNKEIGPAVSRLIEWRGATDLVQQDQNTRIASLESAADALRESLEEVNKTLNRLLLGITGSALTISFALLVATGKVL